MFSYGPPHMAKRNQGDQLEPTYSSSVRIQNVALWTCQKWWIIGRSGKRGSGIYIEKRTSVQLNLLLFVFVSVFVYNSFPHKRFHQIYLEDLSATIFSSILSQTYVHFLNLKGLHNKSIMSVAHLAGGCGIRWLHLCRGVRLPQWVYWIWY